MARPRRRDHVGTAGISGRTFRPGRRRWCARHRYTHRPEHYAYPGRLTFADFPPVASTGRLGRHIFAWPEALPGKGRPPAGGSDLM